MQSFNGLGMSLGNLARLSKAKTRSISAENPTGEKGKGAMAEPSPEASLAHLGRGWKCRPTVDFGPGETVVLADIKGPGAIQSMWMTTGAGRDSILRIYWDDQEQPSVECPMYDFFAVPWCYHASGPTMPGSPFAQLTSLPVAVNPRYGVNCYWEMPFRKRCRITLENLNPKGEAFCYYQINYTLTEVPEDAAYFHAQFRRVNPLPKGDVYTIVDGIKGWGHYVGVSMGWGINHNGWWGEGEVKFYIDGDGEFPTICGTGLEDYFGGAWDWDVDKQYQTYSTPFLGMHQVIKPDGLYSAQLRHALYRWHIMDPVRFEKDLKVTIQALGHNPLGGMQLGTHDICSVAYWYQTLPTAPFPKLPGRAELAVM
jgi:hypothetical protein